MSASFQQLRMSSVLHHAQRLLYIEHKQQECNLLFSSKHVSMVSRCFRLPVGSIMQLSSMLSMTECEQHHCSWVTSFLSLLLRRLPEQDLKQGAAGESTCLTVAEGNCLIECMKKRRNQQIYECVKPGLLLLRTPLP